MRGCYPYCLVLVPVSVPVFAVAVAVAIAVAVAVASSKYSFNLIGSISNTPSIYFISCLLLRRDICGLCELIVYLLYFFSKVGVGIEGVIGGGRR